MRSQRNSAKRSKYSAPRTLCVIYEHDDCAKHDTRQGDTIHQEAADRLSACKKRIVTKCAGVAFTSQFEQASRDALDRIHSKAYLDALEDIERDLQRRSAELSEGRLVEPFSPLLVSRLFPSYPVHGMTMVSAESMNAARRAAGAVCAAIDGVIGYTPQGVGEVDPREPPCPVAFCLVRPPGHHACVHGYDPVAGGSGFCLLNTIAIGAAHAVATHGLRVAMVDFDVHHGNGTENCVHERLSVLPRGERRPPWVAPPPSESESEGESSDESESDESSEQEAVLPAPPLPARRAIFPSLRNVCIPASPRPAPRFPHTLRLAAPRALVLRSLRPSSPPHAERGEYSRKRA